MEIGKKLKNARVQSGMTQENVAEKINVSRQTILFCVILFYRFFLPLYLPLSEFVNTDGTI